LGDFREVHALHDPSIAALAAGGFVAGGISQSSDSDVNSETALANTYNANGSLLSSGILASLVFADVRDYKLSGLSGGTFAAIYHRVPNSMFGNEAVEVAVRTSDGSVVRTELEARSGFLRFSPGFGSVDIAGLANGNAVAVWETTTDGLTDTPGAPSFGIRGQIVGPTGAKISSAFLINTDTAGDQIDPVSRLCRPGTSW
jgi:hypothetical protein